MTDKTKCEFYLAIDENGDWNVNPDKGDVADNLSGQYRVVKITAFVAPPATQEVSIDVPDTAGAVEQIEVA